MFCVRDRFHINLSTNSTKDHIWSTHLMACFVIARAVSILNVSPILNIRLQSRYSCEYNFSFCSWILPIFDIFMPYKSLWLFFWDFTQNPKSTVIDLKISCFKITSTGIQIRKYCTYRNIRRNCVCTNYVQEKGYWDILVLLPTLFVHLFLHIR